MIEKLNITPTQSVETNHCIINKINELVDFANAIFRDVARGYSSFSGVDFANPPQRPEPADKYAEQRKWIGCLVEFNTNDNSSGNSYGILTGISADGRQYPFTINGGEYHAWSVRLPDESLIYKNTNN